MTKPIQSNCAQGKNFAQSREASFRRETRAMVRKSFLTRTEKEILLAFLNHWFVHRGDGAVHPGRKKLAKRAGASMRAVNYALALLRDFEAIEATAYATGNAEGRRGAATEYTVNIERLTVLCETPAKVLRTVRKGANSGISGCKNARFKGAKFAPRNNQCTVVPFRVQGKA
jgi:hypothetical protein